MSLILYGIPNCDTVKKARTWLDEHQLAHTFHDFKKAGLTSDQIALWLKAVPWEALVNKKGMTWRNLPEEKKAAVVDQASAMALMLESSSVIKRPVLCMDNAVLVGFTADLYQQHLKASP
jgi:arsenate reductase